MNQPEEQSSSARTGAVADTGDGMPPRVHAYDYLAVILRYRALFLSIMVVGTALCVVYLMVARQTYTASAVLLPPDKSEGLSLSSLVASSSKLDFKALSENGSAETFVRMIQSRTIGDSIVRRFNLLKRFDIPASDRDLAIDEYLGNLVVASDRQGFLDISYNARTGMMASEQDQRETAKLAADIVNTVIQLLDKMNQQKSISKARRSREFIGKMKTIKRAELDSAQAALLRFQQRNKAIALDKQLEASVLGSSQLQAQIQKAELLLAGARQELTEQTSTVQDLVKQVAELKAQRDRLEGGGSGSQALSLSLRNVPELMRQLANLKLNLEVATQIYTYLEAQYNQEQIQEARELPTVNVMDYAEAPARRSAPRRVLTLSLVVGALALFSTVLVFLLDAYRRSWATVSAERRDQLRGMLGRRVKQPTTSDGAR